MTYLCIPVLYTEILGEHIWGMEKNRGGGRLRNVKGVGLTQGGGGGRMLPPLNTALHIRPCISGPPP